MGGGESVRRMGDEWIRRIGGGKEKKMRKIKKRGKKKEKNKKG
jgi:hypothetical protein